MSLAGVVFSIKGSAHRKIDALYVLPGVVFLTWRYIGVSDPVVNRHFYPFLPFLIGYGLIWIKCWKPCPVRIVGLALFLPAILYPVIYVTADVASIKLPQLGFAAGCPFSETYSFHSLRDHPYLWLWDAADEIEADAGGWAAVAVIDRDWRPAAYVLNQYGFTVHRNPEKPVSDYVISKAPLDGYALMETYGEHQLLKRAKLIYNESWDGEVENE